MLDGSATNGILSSRAAAVGSGFRSAAPTNAATSIAAARNAAARPNAPSLRGDRGFLSAARSRLGAARERVGDRVDERGQARPPARGDVVVKAEDVVVGHGRYARPAGPPGDDRRGLPAVGGLVVGQEDELRPGGD